jgi:monofunctional biosynthetic peptidoglycan transglycosylase
LTAEEAEKTTGAPRLAPEHPPEALPAPPEPTPETPAPRVADQPPPATRPARRRGPLRLVGRAIVAVILGVVIVPPVSALVYKLAPPPITILMIQRLIQGQGMDYRWRALSRMSPALPEAAVASEDARFCLHHGFDFQAIERAMRHNERRPGRVEGGSTISQQTAKNVFLWPGRDYVRKAIEAWYTVLIELVWGKPRIMETYLNVVEFGPGVYGAEAASQRFFHKPASQLSPDEAARLIAVLPKPLSWEVGDPVRIVRNRAHRVERAMGIVRRAGLASCVR